jgi:hypothetical protein
MALIRCNDHRYAPAVIVCVHLFDRQATEWCPVPSGDLEVEHDWLCPACLQLFPEIDVEDLRTVCIHCARKLRESSP